MRWSPAILVAGAIVAVAAVVYTASLLTPTEKNSPAKPLTGGGAPAPQITDLETDAAALLRELPGVAKVDVIPATTKTSRIIHFLDYHYVPRDLYALDFQAPLTDEDYNRHLAKVEAVYADQTAAFGALAIKHGLRFVFIERLTEAELPGLPVKAAGLKEAAKHQGELEKQLSDVRTMLVKAGGDRREKLTALEKEIVDMQTTHRRDKLEMGAAFGLVLHGRLESVLPLDDAGLLAAAKPVLADGTLKADPDAVAKRERAMVTNALKVGPVAVIVCGGGHDLTAAILEMEGGKCEYVRVAGPAYLKAMNGN